MLNVQLENSESSVEEDCPLFVPSIGVEGLHQCAERIKQDKEDSGNSHCRQCRTVVPLF